MPIEAGAPVRHSRQHPSLGEQADMAPWAGAWPLRTQKALCPAACPGCASEPCAGLRRNPSGLSVFIETHGDKRFHSKSFHPRFLLLSASPVRLELGMLSCVFRASSSSTASLFLFCSNLLVFRLPQQGGRAPQVSVKH